MLDVFPTSQFNFVPLSDEYIEQYALKLMNVWPPKEAKDALPDEKVYPVPLPVPTVAVTLPNDPSPVVLIEVLPPIDPPVMLTLLEFCVAMEPRPKLERALLSFEMLKPTDTAPVEGLAERLNPDAELEAETDETAPEEALS